MEKKQYTRIKLPPANCYGHPYAGYRGKKVREELQLIKGTESYRQLRIKMLKRQAFLCAYCGCSLEGKAANIEHILPVRIGGTNKIDNLVMACQPCNKRKGNKLYHKKTRLKIYTESKNKK